ncbi:MAG: hypothetical protein ACUVX8_16900, partial [Candidatus Zipacnadales bacterium]
VSNSNQMTITDGSAVRFHTLQNTSWLPSALIAAVVTGSVVGGFAPALGNSVKLIGGLFMKALKGNDSRLMLPNRGLTYAYESTEYSSYYL